MPSLPGSPKQHLVAVVAVVVVGVLAFTDTDGPSASGDKDGRRDPGPHATTSYPIRFDDEDSSKKHEDGRPGKSGKPGKPGKPGKASYPVTFGSGKAR